MQIAELTSVINELLSSPFLPFIIFGVLAFFTPLIGRLTRKKGAPYWVVLNFAFLLMLLLPNWRAIRDSPISTDVLLLDGLSLIFIVVFSLVGVFVSISSIDYFDREFHTGTYYMLISFASLGMMLVSMAIDLIVMFTSWILVAISTYILVVVRMKNKRTVEASIKYLIVGAVSTAAIILGISFVFGVTGSTRLYEISTVLDTLHPDLYPLALLGLVLIIAGFGFKMGIVPFHMWLPDTYEGAPQPVTALLGGSSSKAAFVAAIRVFLLIFVLFRFQWTLAFALLALVTMTWGNIAALSQKTLPRMLAYSAIAQAGYTLIGLAVPSILGISGLVFHVLNDGLAKTGAFLAAAVVATYLSSTQLDDYNGLGKRMPIVAATLSVILLALAGIPPLNGFFSKLVLFTAAVDGGMIWLALAGVLNSAFSLGYYGWVIKRMYFDDVKDPSQETVRVSSKFKIILLALAATTVIIGLMSGLILAQIEIVVSQFLDML